MEVRTGSIARHADGAQVIRPPGLLEDPDYLTLRPYLFADALTNLERTTHIAVIQGAAGISQSAELQLIAEEIDRIERDWELD